MNQQLIDLAYNAVQIKLMIEEQKTASYTSTAMPGTFHSAISSDGATF